MAFEKFKAGYVKNQKLVAFKNIKNSKGHITLGFDPKMNNFLFKTQRHFSQVQPEMKSYSLNNIDFINNSKALLLPCKYVVKL